MSSPGQQSSGAQVALLLNDLNALQPDVQQYAPQFSSQWGWLVAQGKLIAAGQPASITAATWVSQYRSFLAALQNAEPDQSTMVAQNFNRAVVQGGVTGAEGAVLQSGNSLPNPGDFFASLSQYVPLIVGAVILAIVFPPLLKALEE